MDTFWYSNPLGESFICFTVSENIIKSSHSHFCAMILFISSRATAVQMLYQPLTSLWGRFYLKCCFSSLESLSVQRGAALLISFGSFFTVARPSFFYFDVYLTQLLSLSDVFLIGFILLNSNRVITKVRWR